LPWQVDQSGDDRSRIRFKNWTRQQPGGDTPGVAAAPVALAGAVVPGVARFIVVLSAHAVVFGAGMTVTAGSMLVPPSCAMSC
jgi:hypothetical protein